jgi:septin 7
VVGSDKLISIDGKQTRGRLYPWGAIDITNESHCDFMKLRHMLIQSHMEELKTFTNALYENYRLEKLSVQGVSAGYCNYLTQ